MARIARHPPTEPDVIVSNYPALHRPSLASYHLARGKLPRCEQSMASFAENQRLSVSCNHDLLPHFLSRFDTFQPANVMHLKWPRLRFAVLTTTGIESLNEFRLRQRETRHRWFPVSHSHAHRATPRFQPEQFQCALLAFHLVVNAVVPLFQFEA